MRCLSRIAALAAPLLGVALLAPGLASAQETLPGRMPRILFYVEDSSAMQQAWQGSGTYSASRWTYVRDAIAQVLATAPDEIEFAITMSPNGSGIESYGFEQVAPFGQARYDQIAALTALSSSTMGGTYPYRRTAEGYVSMVKNWFGATSYALSTTSTSLSTSTSITTSTAGWYSPFELSCDELVVIVISAGTDLVPSGTVDSSYTSSNPANGYACSISLATTTTTDGSTTSYDDCLLDNASHYAHHTYVSNYGAGNVVTTHTILVDSLVADTHAMPLFKSAALVGNGTSFTVEQPQAVASALWGAINASISGDYSNGGVTVSPRGDRMFATYFSVQGGYPLDSGHLLAFELDDDPQSGRFGRVVAGTGPLDSQWDAGALLAARPVLPGENNQGGFLPSGARNGFIAPASGTMYGAFDSFDAAGLSSGSLAADLIDLVPASANPGCAVLDYDYDYDCDSDLADAQILVDFLRGEPNTTFRHSTMARGSWRLGDPGHSRPVYAPASSATVATDRTFANYQQKLEQKPSMVYLATNSGMLHGFDADTGTEYWFVLPRAKARWTASNEYTGHRAQDLMHSGQTAVNSGRINLQHVWLDGYVSDLPGCNGPAYDTSVLDGIEDPSGCEWHRILVWNGGFGSRHTYAIDITNPENPRFLWERTDDSSTGGGQGRAMGAPAVASFVDQTANPPQMRWLTVRTAGPHGPEAVPGGDKSKWAQGALYVSDMEEGVGAPTQYPAQGFKVPVPQVTNKDTDTFDEYDPAVTEGLFGTPGLADLDGDGSVDVGYFGDSLGNMFKILFQQDKPLAPKICTFYEPTNAKDTSLAAYHSPSVFYDSEGRLMVWWATGGPFDRDDASARGALYARMDPAPYDCKKSVDPPCNGIFDSHGVYPFGADGEKVAGALTVRDGRAFFSTYVRGSDQCSAGTGRLYGVDVKTCGAGLFDAPGDGYAVTSSLYTEISGVVSEPVFANGRLYTLRVDGDDLSASDVVDNFVVRPDNNRPVYFVSSRSY